MSTVCALNKGGCYVVGLIRTGALLRFLNHITDSQMPKSEATVQADSTLQAHQEEDYYKKDNVFSRIPSSCGLYCTGSCNTT